MNEVQQPSWSKLSSNLQKLQDKPWKFGLFKALNLLETEWAELDEMQIGLSSRVLITPNKELGFPVSDIRKASLLKHGRGVFHVESNYSGLYGVDAAMPHYLLEQAAGDDLAAARTRAFLDMFNHLYYCLLYQSWKKSQLTIKGIGSDQFEEVLNAILSGRHSTDTHAGVAVLKTSSASGMAKLLCNEFNCEQITVDDSSPNWQPVGNSTKLGDEGTSVLGESVILGDHVLVSGGKVIVELGEMEESRAKSFFPGSTNGNKLQKLIESQLPSDLSWECTMSIHHDYKAIQQLGDDTVILGVNSHIGEVSQLIEFQQFKDSQYKQRMAQAR
ncbi:type VI secretion system baseplate subunit TssG [Colwellia sp. D2M02]|uniref:type VI secretion system baseplate subunit TssG n=1 Tax=Colwellia sp. D2M02 TaxID=2841562 RepID=UPI001C08AB13|nr:type VI secretion system baseplate subunit TssG [Colwellia sp. D2M02]